MQIHSEGGRLSWEKSTSLGVKKGRQARCTQVEAGRSVYGVIMRHICFDSSFILVMRVASGVGEAVGEGRSENFSTKRNCEIPFKGPICP